MIDGRAGCDLDAYAGIRGTGAGEKGRDRGPGISGGIYMVAV